MKLPTSLASLFGAGRRAPVAGLAGAESDRGPAASKGTDGDFARSLAAASAPAAAPRPLAKGSERTNLPSLPKASARRFSAAGPVLVPAVTTAEVTSDAAAAEGAAGRAQKTNWWSRALPRPAELTHAAATAERSEEVKALQPGAREPVAAWVTASRTTVSDRRLAAGQAAPKASTDPVATQITAPLIMKVAGATGSAAFGTASSQQKASVQVMQDSSTTAPPPAARPRSAVVAAAATATTPEMNTPGATAGSTPIRPAAATGSLAPASSLPRPAFHVPSARKPALARATAGKSGLTAVLAGEAGRAEAPARESALPPPARESALAQAPAFDVPLAGKPALARAAAGKPVLVAAPAGEAVLPETPVSEPVLPSPVREAAPAQASPFPIPSAEKRALATPAVGKPVLTAVPAGDAAPAEASAPESSLAPPSASTFAPASPSVGRAALANVSAPKRTLPPLTAVKAALPTTSAAEPALTALAAEPEPAPLATVKAALARPPVVNPTPTQASAPSVVDPILAASSARAAFTPAHASIRRGPRETQPTEDHAAVGSKESVAATPIAVGMPSPVPPSLAAPSSIGPPDRRKPPLVREIHAADAVSIVTPSGPQPAQPVQPAREFAVVVGAEQADSSLPSSAPKGQASPLNRPRSVLAPAASSLSSTGSIVTPVQVDKGAAAKKTIDGKDASPASKAATAAVPDKSAQALTGRQSESVSEGGGAADRHPSDAHDDSSAGTRSDAAVLSAPTDTNPTAAVFAASAAAANVVASAGASITPTTHAGAGTTVAGSAVSARSKAAETDRRSPVSGHGAVVLPLGADPVFETVAPVIGGRPTSPASILHAVSPSSVASRAAATASEHGDHTGVAANAAAANNAAVPAPAMPAAVPAPIPAAVDAGTLGAHLAGQSFGLSPGANLPALFGAAPPEAAAFFTQAVEDPTLYGAVMTDSAHVSLDAGAAGEITLHLRVKDGVADVRVEGAGVPSLAIHPQDLQAALASEGLSLGGFESGQAPRDGQAQFDRSDTERPTPDAGPRTGVAAVFTRPTPSTVTQGGRLHVTA